MAEKCDCAKVVKATKVESFCEECGHIFKRIDIKKPLTAGAIAAVLAYTGSQAVELAVTDHRYPLETEYALVEACVDGARETLSYRRYQRKRSICLCALENTTNDISYTGYIIDDDNFIDTFKQNKRECIDER